MNNIFFKIFIKDDDNISIGKMELDCNSILKIRDKFYNSFKEVVKTVDVVKNENYSVPLYDGEIEAVPVLTKLTKDGKEDNETLKDYLKITNKEILAQYRIDYCKPNNLMESFAFPVVNAELSKYNTEKESINKNKYRDLFYKNGHFDVLKFLNKEKFFNYASVESDCLVQDDIIQSALIYTMWLNYVITYEPQNKFEEILKENLKDCIRIHEGSNIKKETIIKRLINSNTEYFLDENKSSGVLKSKILKKVLKQPTIVLDEEKVKKFKNDLDSYLVEESKIEKNIVPTEYELDII